jgi:hypothetical protein
MAARSYWLNLFSIQTWQEFLNAGASVTGFRENRWSQVQRVAVGDYMLCYLTGVSRFVGILEVVCEPYKDASHSIWKDAFPCRLKVRVIAKLTPETGVPITDLADSLSFFQNLKSPNAWTGQVRGSPAKWKNEDGEVVLEAVRNAERNPLVRPIDHRKLRTSPRRRQTDRLGSVTVPDDIDDVTVIRETPSRDSFTTDEETSAHSEIQWKLLKLGNDLGLDVWVARNDRNRSANGNRFTDLPRMRHHLPRQFDDATTRTIELIDVLWLRGNAIVAAFEVESTTVIYSGLLRMADLLAMQPNLNIPLYVVAPEERRAKVIAEVNRPTFSRLQPPLRDACRYISFDTLRERLPELERFVQYLKPDVLRELSESCAEDGP